MRSEAELLNNPMLKAIQEKDPVLLICSLFITYHLKENVAILKRIPYFQYNAKLRSFRSKSKVFATAYTYATLNSALSGCYLDIIDYVGNHNNSECAFFLKNLIMDFLSSHSSFNESIEKLEINYIGEKIKDIFVLSPYPKKNIFEKADDSTSIIYNFYEEKVNIVSMVYFELNGIKHSLLDLDTIQTALKNKKFDSIIFTPPYKNQYLMQRILKMERELNSPSSSIEWRLMNFLFPMLKDKGKMVSIVSSGILNKVSDSRFRMEMFNTKSINAIVELPRLSLSSLSLSMILFSRGNSSIKVVNATKFAQNLRRGIDLDSEKINRALDGLIEDAIKTMDGKYLKDNDFDFTPHRFFERSKTDFINPTELKDVTVSIFRGFQIPSSMIDNYASIEKTKIKLLALSDIEDGIIKTENMQSLTGIDKKMEHYILKKNDLVISCKGKTFKTSVVDPPYGETYISTGSLVVIRCADGKIDSTYLKIFLDSSYGISALKRIQTGGSILSLNPSKLKTLIIPLPPYSKQIVVSSSYKYKINNLKEVEEVMESMKKEIDKKFNENFLSLIE